MKKENIKKIPEKNPEITEDDERPVLAGFMDGVAKHRKSIFRIAILYLLISFSSLLFFSDYLMFAVNWPFAETGLKLNVFRLVDGLYIKIKAAFTLGLIVVIPVVVFGLRKIFIAAFGDHNRRFINLSVFFGLILFYGGAVSSYFVIPMASKVLLSFTPEDMVNTINASQFFGFIIFFCLSMGVVFELPIFILVLSRIGIVTPEFLVKKRKYAIVMAWITAAIITPTVDPLTQAIVAVPLMLLYEISILIARMMLKRKKKREGVMPA
jgi:sec-independent protein translocase protein TatC